MRLLTRLLAATALALPLAALAASDTEARVIVRFKPQADSVRAKAMSATDTRQAVQQIAQTRATALGLRHGHVLTAGLSLDTRTHVVMATGLSSAALAKSLAADPEVELVAVDGRRRHTAARLPSDPLFGGAAVNPESTNTDGSTARTIDQWYLKKPETASSGRINGPAVSSINAPDAWAISTGSASSVVAVIDTGVRLDHPDLAGKFLAGYDFIGFGFPGNATVVAMAGDGNGADSDASDPGDFVTQADVSGALKSVCTSSDISNSSWHGTRVSGLIGANSNNGLGMAGVSWGAKILPVRVLGKCGGFDSDIMAGMKWAAGLSVPGVPANPNKAKVLNMSLGGGGSCATTDSTGTLYRQTIDAINATGSIIVVAAGNESGAVGLPGNCPGVITVGALRHVGTKVGFANLGPEVTISAPGGNCINTGANQPCLYPMVSTVNAGTTTPIAGDASYTGSDPSVGTSFSTPIVSGVVALMASVRPSLTYNDVKGILTSTVRPFPTSGSPSQPAPPQCSPDTSTDQNECYCTTTTCGAGMLDAAAALAAVQALNGATVTISPPSAGATAGSAQTLTVSVTGLAAGRSIKTYAWTLLDGGGIVSAFTSGADTASPTVTPTAAGTFTVGVTLTDDLGQTYTQSLSVSVAAAPVVTPPSTGGGGGGGGASSGLWLALLLMAAWALPGRTLRSAARR